MASRLSRRTAIASAAAASLAALGVPRARRRAGVDLLPSGADRPGVDAAHGTAAAPDTTASFRSRPDLRPPVVETTWVRTPWAGFVFVSPTGPLVLDNAGSPVWIHPVPHASTNFQVQRYQGQPVLTWWQGEIASYGVGLHGHDVIMDPSYNVVARVQPGNGLPSDLHEFNLTERGTALLTAYTETEADLRSVGGPSRGTVLDAVFQEVDVATGEVVLEWRAMDHIALTESHASYTSKGVYDPFHVNSVGVMPDGDLLVSARNTWALYKVGRTTGRIEWRLGGKKSDFSMGRGSRFAWQHDARWHADGSISVFDDEGTPYVGPRARGLILDVDEKTMHVSLKRVFDHPGRKLRVGSQGSVQVLANGDVMVGWGSEPYFTEFRYDGSLVLDGKYARGTSYRAYRFEWHGTPTEPPAAAVERTATGLAVYASWNGATDVASWQALGGSSPTRLGVLGTEVRTGFETAIAVNGAAAWFKARALDASGAALGESEAVRAPA